MLIAIISVTKGYTEEPSEYEAQGVSHIEYEADQMAMKMSPGSVKVKRMVQNEQPSEYETVSVTHAFHENNQTPAEDRNWQVKPKVKRMSTKTGRKVHIYLKNEDSKNVKPKRRQLSSTTTTTATSSINSNEGSSSTEKSSEIVESQTKKTPELTTKADRDVKQLKYADKDTIAAESSHSKQLAGPSDSKSESSDHSEHVIKEKIKIKHHHHHHHHNHVKTVVKKEPYAVEKIVHVPVEKIVEKKVPYKVEVPVEKIVEKVKFKALANQIDNR